jgi:16S rRNA (guanine1516-N2)-methyltransferase
MSIYSVMCGIISADHFCHIPLGSHICCMNTPSICIVCSNVSKTAQANALATQLGIPLVNEKNNDFDLQLRFNNDYVELFDTALNTAILVDFVEGALAHRRQFGGGRGQAIAKAVGLKQGNTPSVLDITAGLARDAYILACLGCKVTLVEQSPVLYTLIENGILRGLTEAQSVDALTNFMNLVNADSIQYMEHMDKESRPDVIYIDPMYPERKKSALVKKDMQILQHLLGKDENAGLLLKTAIKYAAKRVVVKRPIHAESVGGIKPGTSISSKKTRYDVYLVNS